MDNPPSNFDTLYQQLLANSLFTPRQVSIILNQLKGGGRPKNISSGAYYRQVNQCRKKINSILFSMVLLQSIGVVKIEAFAALSKVSEQLAVIFASADSDAQPDSRIDDVISVIDELVKRMSGL